MAESLGVTGYEPPEPPTIARLREALGQHDYGQMVDKDSGRPYTVVEAARAVLDEWDRVAAVRHEATKAALRDSVVWNGLVLPPHVAALLEPGAGLGCPMASKCKPGDPCEHYPPDHPLHVHADCCK